ncbi:hypothetical protein BGZ94_009552, partial [Podila epigama]
MSSAFASQLLYPTQSPTSTSFALEPTATSVPITSAPYVTGASFVYSDNTLKGAPETLLCDWIRSASDCRDGDFIRALLIASSAMHLFVFIFGTWLLAYRNRGFNFKIVTELFVLVGTGIRPKP